MTASAMMKSRPRSMAVFRALQLGDMLCAVPVFRALRRAFPSTRITLVGLPWAKEFVNRFQAYIDDFISFPGYPGLPEQRPDVKAIPSFFQSVQERQFDWAIQLHGSGSFVNPIVSLMGAKRTAGFFTPGDYCPVSDFFMPYPNEGSEIERLLKLISFLGIPSQGTQLEFPLSPKAHRDLEALHEAKDLKPHGYVCLHPGARFLSRRWPVERFAEVGDQMVRHGFKVVITGSMDEKPLADSLASSMRHPAINLAGRTTLDSLGLLLKQARILVSNDTGVSHIASALKVPSIIIVTGSDPDRWAPLDRSRHRVVMHPINCRPCFYQVCPIGHPCALHVTPDKVFSESRKKIALRPMINELAIPKSPGAPQNEGH